MKTTRTHIQVIDEDGRQLILWRVSYIADQYADLGHKAIEYRVEYRTEGGDIFEPEEDGSYRCLRSGRRLVPA